MNENPSSFTALQNRDPQKPGGQAVLSAGTE